MTTPSITFSNTEYRRKIVAELIKMHGGFVIEDLTTITYYNETAKNNDVVAIMARRAEREVEVA